jgi:hypothetical protein
LSFLVAGNANSRFQTTGGEMKIYSELVIEQINENLTAYEAAR